MSEKSTALVEVRKVMDAPTMQSQVAMALPKSLTVERFTRELYTLIQKTPELADCTSKSIICGAMLAAELGLELSTVLGQAYLVPRWNSKKGCKEATFQVGYRGFISLAFRSGQVKDFQIRTVYENDEFSYEYGTEPFIRHKPTLKDPGAEIAYYSVIHLANGGSDFVVMSRAAIEQHRLAYCKDSEKGFSPWQKSYGAMAQKTTARQLAKRVPISVEFQRAALEDEYGEAGIVQPTLLIPDADEGPAPTKTELLAMQFDGAQDAEVIDAPK